MQISQALPIFAIYFLSSTAAGTSRPECPHGAVFRKILGMRPGPAERETGGVVPLYAGASQSPLRDEAINAKCARLCRENTDCRGYLLVFSQNVCYGYIGNRTATTDYDYIDESNHQLVADANVAFFVKTTCLDVPPKCATSRMFPLVTIPGASMIGQYSQQLPRLVTRDECANACFRERRFACRSARFVRSYRNNRHRLWVKVDRAQMGQCFLSRADRISHPEAFRRGWEDDEEYLENQCHAADRNEARCSFEQLHDAAFVYADDSLVVSGEKSCGERCLSEDRFICLGYSFSNATRKGTCFLHSDDLTTIGPKAVRMQFESIYARRVPCLKLEAKCYSHKMELIFQPDVDFHGNLHLKTAQSNCSVEVNTNGTKGLEIAIGNEVVESRCGIRRAFIKGNMLDFLVFSYVYIQQHPLVRTQSDRLLKMGCIHHRFDSTNMTQLMDNLPMQSTVDFIPHSQSFAIGATEVHNGTSKVLKHVATVLRDVETRAEIFEATLGQLLEMRIESSKFGYDLMPQSLVAYSGEQTVELLNDKGCPLDRRLFPGFRKKKNSSEILLEARFHAFMFPSSTMVNFRLTIQFCYDACPKAVCFYQ